MYRIRELIGIGVFVAGAATTAGASTIAVATSADLQPALNRAQPGDVIELAGGTTFIGNFVLPANRSTTLITVQSAPHPSLPPENQRVQPADAAQMAKLRSPNSQPALQTAPGAHHWRVQLLEFQANAGGVGDIITLGDGSSAQTTLASVPHTLVIDRCYIHGDADGGQKRGIALNSATTTVSNSYISDMKTVGQDSQAIEAWNGPGPFTLTNNYFEAAGEALLFGGADPSIPNLVPSDIVVSGNTLSRPTAWRGTSWQVKNILELKNARRATITHNLLEYNWQAAQNGFAVLFTVRNQDGRCPWCQVEDVLFEFNIVRHSAAGVSILGVDNNNKSEQTRGIVIRNNIFDDIDNERWGGNGYFLAISGGPRDITVDHNTIIQEHASGILQVEGPPVFGFVFTNNVARHNAYGVIGSDRAPGNDTISSFFPAARIAGNVIAGGDGSRYPGGNKFPSIQEFRNQFVGYDDGDYTLKPGSAWNTAATDGSAVGARLSGTAGRRPGTPTPPRTRRGDDAPAQRRRP